MDGTWAPSVYWGGIADGVVDISDFGDCVSEETKAAVNEAREKIVSGEFDVFTGEIKDQNGEVKVAEGQKLSDEELLSMMWFVEGVIGEIGAK